MTEIERIIEDTEIKLGVWHYTHEDDERATKIAQAIEQYVIKARIEELENCKSDKYKPNFKTNEVGKLLTKSANITIKCFNDWCDKRIAELKQALKEA